MALTHIFNGDTGAESAGKINNGFDKTDQNETDIVSLDNRVTQNETDIANEDLKIVNEEVIGEQIYFSGDNLFFPNGVKTRTGDLFLKIPKNYNKDFTKNYQNGSGNGSYAGEETSFSGGYTYEIYIALFSVPGDTEIDIITKTKNENFDYSTIAKVKIGEFDTDYSGKIVKLWQLFELDGKKNPLQVLPKNYVKNNFYAQGVSQVYFGKTQINYLRDHYMSILIKTVAEFERGTNVGMFDSSTITDGQYYIYAIFGDNGLKDYFCSKNAYPIGILPAGFDYFVNIGYLVISSGDIVEIWNTDDMQYIEGSKEYSPGTGGGNVTAGYNVFDITNISTNKIVNASYDIGNDTITLPTGIYNIIATSSAYNIRSFFSLKDVATDEIVTRSITADSTNSGVELHNSIHGNFELTATTTLRFELYSSSARTNGFGTADNLASINEVYGGFLIHKIK